MPKMKTPYGDAKIKPSRGVMWHGYRPYADEQRKMLTAYYIDGISNAEVRVVQLRERGDWQCVIGGDTMHTEHNKIDAQIYVEKMLGLR